MCNALDMPCGARGDLDHIEFAKQIYRIRLRIYRFCASKNIDKNPDAVFASGFLFCRADKKADAPIFRCVRCIQDFPRSKGKKQEGVKEVRGEGRRKNLDRGNLPNLAHPVESRGRQGQAESVGIKFVSAANQREEDFRRAENIFCFGLALFV
jgi:hypothetical protein